MTNKVKNYWHYYIIILSRTIFLKNKINKNCYYYFQCNKSKNKIINYRNHISCHHHFNFT